MASELLVGDGRRCSDLAKSEGGLFIEQHEDAHLVRRNAKVVASILVRAGAKRSSELGGACRSLK